jgi:hypothetical protein
MNLIYTIAELQDITNSERNNLMILFTKSCFVDFKYCRLQDEQRIQLVQLAKAFIDTFPSILECVLDTCSKDERVLFYAFMSECRVSAQDFEGYHDEIYENAA